MEEKLKLNNIKKIKKISKAFIAIMLCSCMVFSVFNINVSAGVAIPWMDLIPYFIMAVITLLIMFGLKVEADSNNWNLTQAFAYAKGKWKQAKDIASANNRVLAVSFFNNILNYITIDQTGKATLRIPAEAFQEVKITMLEVNGGHDQNVQYIDTIEVPEGYIDPLIDQDLEEALYWDVSTDGDIPAATMWSYYYPIAETLNVWYKIENTQLKITTDNNKRAYISEAQIGDLGRYVGIKSPTYGANFQLINTSTPIIYKELNGNYGVGVYSYDEYSANQGHEWNWFNSNTIKWVNKNYIQVIEVYNSDGTVYCNITKGSTAYSSDLLIDGIDPWAIPVETCGIDQAFLRYMAGDLSGLSTGFINAIKVTFNTNVETVSVPVTNTGEVAEPYNPNSDPEVELPDISGVAGLAALLALILAQLRLINLKIETTTSSVPQTSSNNESSSRRDPVIIPPIIGSAANGAINTLISGATPVISVINEVVNIVPDEVSGVFWAAVIILAIVGAAFVIL